MPNRPLQRPSHLVVCSVSEIWREALRVSLIFPALKETRPTKTELEIDRSKPVDVTEHFFCPSNTTKPSLQDDGVV